MICPLRRGPVSTGRGSKPSSALTNAVIWPCKRTSAVSGTCSMACTAELATEMVANIPGLSASSGFATSMRALAVRVSRSSRLLT